MTRFRQILNLLFALHVLAGLVVIAVLIFASPWTIGVGRFDEAIKTLETIDWRWWVLVPVLLVWSVPIVAVVSWQQARRAGLEAARVGEMVTKLLQNKQIPISVDVDASVPVYIEAPLRIPVEVDTRVAIDEAIDIETEVPIRTELPLDTEVETKVFGLGTIRIPIRAMVPIDLVLPIKGQIRVKTAGIPVQLRDVAIVRLPAFDVPIKARIETRIDLLDNLLVAQKAVRKSLSGPPASAGPQPPVPDEE